MSKKEILRGLLTEELEIGKETNTGLDSSEKVLRFQTRTVKAQDMCKKLDLSASQFFGLLDILKKEGFILDHSFIPLYSSVTPLVESGEYETEIMFPLPTKDAIELNGEFARIDYNSRDRKIYYIEGRNKYLMAQMRFDSPNNQFFDYIYENSNKGLNKENIKNNVKPLRNVNQILTDLGFRATFRKMFFPGVSSNGVYFRNPITKQQFNDLEINPKKLKEDVKRLRKERK